MVKYASNMTKNHTDSLAPSRCIGAKVTEIRNGRGWTQARLADRCTHFGQPTTQSEVARIERGTRGRRVTIELWIVLSLALDVPPMALLRSADRVDVMGRPETGERLTRWFVGQQPLDIVTDHHHYREHAIRPTTLDHVPGIGATLRYVAGALDAEDRTGQVEAIDAALAYLKGARKAATMYPPERKAD